MQNDGALAASGGMDAIARVWDMRTGRNIYTCQVIVHDAGLLRGTRGYGCSFVLTRSAGVRSNPWFCQPCPHRSSLPTQLPFWLQGHVKAVLSLDFSPCGYLLATGSEDNTARVWDLRKRQVLSVLPGECLGAARPAAMAVCAMA